MMIYTKNTKKAIRIAFDAHKEHVDKAGLPYIFHPFHLAEQMETEDEVIVALLHDVVEDSNITLEDLRARGFSENIMEALSLLTHDNCVEYMDYIEKIKSNPLAVKVMLAGFIEIYEDSVYSKIKSFINGLSMDINAVANAVELPVAVSGGRGNA